MDLRQLYVGAKFVVLAYSPTDGTGQVVTHLGRLDQRDRKRVAALLERAAEHGPPKNREQYRKVAGEDFWEFKARTQRIFWC